MGGITINLLFINGLFHQFTLAVRYLRGIWTGERIIWVRRKSRGEDASAISTGFTRGSWMQPGRKIRSVQDGGIGILDF